VVCKFWSDGFFKGEEIVGVLVRFKFKKARKERRQTNLGSGKRKGREKESINQSCTKQISICCDLFVLMRFLAIGSPRAMRHDRAIGV